MSRRFISTIAIAVTMLIPAALAAGPAAAQSAVAVAQGASFTVENANECAPDADVAVFFTAGIGTPERIGTTVTDADGHFSTEVTLPGSATLGPATVTVECGISGSVLLYDVVVIEPAGFDPMAYAPYAIGVLVLILAVAVVVSRRERGAEVSDPVTVATPLSTEAVPGDVPVGAEGVATAPLAFDAPAADSAAAASVNGAATWSGAQEGTEPHPEGGSSEADVSEPDYWIWDVHTERGPAKRLACLSEDAFFLHEVPEAAFNALLELLAAVGPDEALGSAFMRVALDDINEVRTRGTMVRVTYRGPDGPVVRTLDLANGSQGVIDLLSTRVPVIADNPQAAISG